MDIAGEHEPDYISARIDSVGFIDPYRLEGIVVLRSDDGKEFHIRAFSGEVAMHMAYMQELASHDGAGKEIQIPSIYNMISELCEESEVMLVKAKVYQSGEALRANLYFTGKKDIVLRNYRASDAIALAALYRIPILVRSGLLKDKDEIMRELDSTS